MIRDLERGIKQKISFVLSHVLNQNKRREKVTTRSHVFLNVKELRFEEHQVGTHYRKSLVILGAKRFFLVLFLLN
ncbi:hypothetical protein UAW_02727 [Enterococcus haemoperoxidus ATCC BAA-382]|uniref:Uncharacterized protein n=1 Tax=Enterococcus haemoperoxidus ATCC BAA-382 TaxID=1158608 RepID=R2Q981_9ENTE|nr:hypothetical protein UAW_02727 [Enterococcus haemoperoxidus ATCC BAA-382]EOT61431.1 hypothetical protein I583_00410 [Enterococcus haemoperoxidus ATCC BAA-382]